MVAKAYDARGTDWLELVIPPEDEDGAEYSIRFHMSFLLSNWGCIFANGCPGMFGKQSSTINDDVGCCGDSFYFSEEAEVDRVRARMEQLTDADWDKDLRAYVEKHGFVHVINNGKGNKSWSGKGRVIDGGCVFQNRNGGSSGHTGCAFHWLGQRTGEDHVDTMPAVCWQLPLRFVEEDETHYSVIPWDVHEWNVDGWEFEDRSFVTQWWCVDTPEAYSGSTPVYKSMERELRELIGDRPYEMFCEAVEHRLERGYKPPAMPGAIVNDGRPLLPLLVGNRTPRREPSYFPAFLDNIKDNINNEHNTEQGSAGS